MGKKKTKNPKKKINLINSSNSNSESDENYSVNEDISSEEDDQKKIINNSNKHLNGRKKEKNKDSILKIPYIHLNKFNGDYEILGIHSAIGVSNSNKKTNYTKIEEENIDYISNNNILKESQELKINFILNIKHIKSSKKFRVKVTNHFLKLIAPVLLCNFYQSHLITNLPE